MVWAHIMSKSSVMGNAFEYQEIMQAAMQFGTTRTVEEVAAEHKAKHDADERERSRTSGRGKTGGGATPFSPGGQTRPAPSTLAKPKQSEMDKVRAMLAAGTQRPVPAAEPAAE